MDQERKDLMELRIKFCKKKQAVMLAVHNIEKNGRNKHQNYDFVQEADVNRAVRQALMDAGLDPSVSASPSCVAPIQNGKMVNYVFDMICTLTDIETGYRESYPWIGMGADSGDKALYKAYTSGMKYFLMKTFLIPTGDDVENDQGNNNNQYNNQNQNQNNNNNNRNQQNDTSNYNSNQGNGGGNYNQNRNQNYNHDNQNQNHSSNDYPAPGQSFNDQGNSQNQNNDQNQNNGDQGDGGHQLNPRATAVMNAIADFYTKQAATKMPGFVVDETMLANEVYSVFGRFPEQQAGAKQVQNRIPLNKVVKQVQNNG